MYTRISREQWKTLTSGHWSWLWLVSYLCPSLWTQADLDQCDTLRIFSFVIFNSLQAFTFSPLQMSTRSVWSHIHLKVRLSCLAWGWRLKDSTVLPHPQPAALLYVHPAVPITGAKPLTAFRLSFLMLREAESDHKNYLNSIHLKRSLCRGCYFPGSFSIVLTTIQRQKS